jgi:hypothetical protein
LIVRAVTVTAVILAVSGVTLSLVTGLNHLRPQTYLALVVIAFVPFLIAMVGRRLRPRAYELWGDFRGMTILIFSSDEERQYGQVTRALVRAQEAARLGGVAEPPSELHLYRRATR